MELTPQACPIGRASKTVREFLEKHYTDNLERDETIKLTIKALLEVVQTGAKNIEISVMESYGVVRVSSCFVAENKLTFAEPRADRDRGDRRADRVGEGGRGGAQEATSGADAGGPGVDVREQPLRSGDGHDDTGAGRDGRRDGPGRGERRAIDKRNSFCRIVASSDVKSDIIERPLPGGE